MPDTEQPAVAASASEPRISISCRPTRRRYWVISLLCAMYLITYMDRTNLSIIAPLISKEFNFDKLTMGFIFSAFSWSYTIFQIPCGYLGDRFGPRRMLGTFALYWSALTAVIIAARTATGFWMARFFFGIGEAGAFPTATRAMTFWVPATERGFAQGFTHAFSRLGSALTPPLTVWVARRWGWRTAFIFFAVAGGLWAILWLLTYRDRPEQDRRVNDEELAVIRAQGAGNSSISLAGADEQTVRSSCFGLLGSDAGSLHLRAERHQVPWASLLGSSNMWAINLQYFAYGYSLWFYLTWLPTYFIDVRHFSFMATGIYSSIPFLAGMIGDMFGGWLCDYTGKRTGNLKLSRGGVGAAAMALTAVFLIPGAATGNPALAVVLLSVAAFFLEMNIGPAWAVVMDVGGEYAGTVSGMMNMFGSLAGGLSPIIFAAVWQRTGSAVLPFLISGSLMIVGAVAWLFIDPTRSVLGRHSG
jgi:sugar phosphate permease